MLPKEIISKIRQIEIRTNRLVNDVFAGEYESVFKGRGMEFTEVREYVPGDDVRSIDWNVTARFGKPYVKKFIEERELTVMLVVDVSGSEEFGSVARVKREVVAEVAAVLAFSAIVNNDKVGYLAYSDHVEKFIRPQKGKRHVLRVIREILYTRPTKRGTSLKSALEYIGRVLTKRGVIFLISDFWDQGYEQMLRILQKRHDCIAIRILDTREKEIPKIGLLEVEDTETGESLLVDTSNRKYREELKEHFQALYDERTRLFRSIGLDTIELETHRPYLEPLIRFFQRRARRFR